MSDLRQAKAYKLWMKSLGWQVEKGMFIKKLLGISFIKIQRQKKPMVAFKGVGIIKLEPAFEDKTDYLKLGFKKDSSPMLPRKTVWLDLKKSEKQLLKEMHYKTRYNLKRFKEKVKIVRGDKVSNIQLEEFFAIYRKNCKRQKFWGLKFKQLKNLVKSFGEKTWLLETDGAGLLVLIHDKVVYYSHNASGQAGRKIMAPSQLVWAAVKLGKNLGCVRFDFEGIDDKLWPGFTRFKKSFGGKEVEYGQPVKKLFFREGLWPR